MQIRFGGFSWVREFCEQFKKKNMERKAILRKPPIFKYNKRQINGDHTGPLVINDTNKTLQKTNFICPSG